MDIKFIDKAADFTGAVVYVHGKQARVIKVSKDAFVVETKNEKGIFPKSDFRHFQIKTENDNQATLS